MSLRVSQDQCGSSGGEGLAGALAAYLGFSVWKKGSPALLLACQGTPIGGGFVKVPAYLLRSSALWGFTMLSWPAKVL